jgi:hypothetical protein
MRPFHPALSAYENSSDVSEAFRRQSLKTAPVLADVTSRA